MTSDLRPGLHPFSHLKASPTTSSSSQTALPSTVNQHAQPPPRPRSRKNRVRDEFVDPTSERATTTLIRRVLCPQVGSYGASTPQSLEELLPPLTSSNDVDRQLYALIAIIVKEFIYSWYSKITADQALVNEILQVIAHCTRALEQRLRQVDAAQLILDEIPSLVEAHVISYRLAKQQPNLSGLPPSTRTVYHALNPHPGLSPVPDPTDPITVAQQSENEALYRHTLAHGALAVLLPTEDLENPCLRTLLGDILADLILGNEISGKMCEGRFLWETVSKLIIEATGQTDEMTEGHQEDQLKKFGLLTTEEEPKDQPSTLQARASAWIWSFLHFVYLAYVALSFIATGLGVTSTASASRSTSACPISHGNEAPRLPGGATGKRPVLNYRVYGMISQLMDVPRRMPWLTGMLALLQYMILAGPGRLGDTDSNLDRFLHETIDGYLLTPTLLPNLLRATRAALFPGNARPNRDQGPGPLAQPPATSPTSPSPSPHDAVKVQVQAATPPPADLGVPSTATDKSNTTSSSSPPSPQPSSISEIATIKRRCAVRILSLIPKPIACSFWGSPADVSLNSIGNAEPNHDHSNNPTTTTSSPSINTNQNQNHTGPTTPTTPATKGAQGEQADEDRHYIQTIESDLLDLFADDYCNKHLVFAILELVLVRLLPELTDRGVTELLEVRGVAGSFN